MPLIIDSIEYEDSVTDPVNDGQVKQVNGRMKVKRSGQVVALVDCVGKAVDPVATDDGASGYPLGSVWINTATDTVFESVDASTGAAIWNESLKIGHAHTEADITDLHTHANQASLDLISGTNTGDEVSASTTVQGVVELATQTEVNTGTDAVRAVTPSTLANSTHIHTHANKASLDLVSGTNTGDEPTFTGAGTSGIVPDPVTASGNFLKDDGTWAAAGGGGAAGDQAGLVVERTTDLVLSGTYQEMTFDTTSIENDPSSLEHNNSSTERLDFKSSGLHQISLSFSCDNTANVAKVLEAELRINGTPVKILTLGVAKSAEELINRTTAITATAGTYLTVAFRQQGGGSDLTIKATTVLYILKATGEKGDQGDPGSNEIVIQKDDATIGTTTATLNFEGAGVSSVVDEGANKTTVTIAGGGGGGSQNRIDIAVHPHNAAFKNTAATAYEDFAIFMFGGSTLMGTPLKVYVNAWMAATSSNGSVRLYDRTNSLVIAESASITATSNGTIVDLGTLSNVPTGQAVFVIQAKVVTGQVNCSSLSIEF